MMVAVVALVAAVFVLAFMLGSEWRYRRYHIEHARKLAADLWDDTYSGQATLDVQCPLCPCRAHYELSIEHVEGHWHHTNGEMYLLDANGARVEP